MASVHPDRAAKPSLPPTRAWMIRMYLVIFAAMAVAMAWVGAYGWYQTTVGTHYTATVVRCYGGRYNPCDILVRTDGGAVPARANLTGVHSGQAIRVIAEGAPPWRHVTQLDNPWAAPDIIGLFLIAAIALTGCAILLRRVAKTFGLRALVVRQPRASQLVPPRPS